MKRIIALLLTLTLCFMLIACGNEKDTSSTPDTSTIQTENESTNSMETTDNGTIDEGSSNTKTPSDSTPTTSAETSKPTTSNKDNTGKPSGTTNIPTTGKPTETNKPTSNTPNTTKPTESFKPNTPTVSPNDKQGPELVSLTLDKTNVSVGDVINFTAVINDASSIHCAQFQFKSGADWHNVFFDLVSGNTYKGQLRITDSFLNATYSISYIFLEDYADNTTDTTHSATFTVANKNSPHAAPNDKQGPELVSLTLDKTNVSVGDVINFTAVINDASSIHCAQFQFKSGADWHNVFFDLVSGNTYKGQLRITDSFLNATYSISYIFLEDYADNTTDTTHSATFTVNR